jgi:glycosyltransferase involved in cell wall biosynthesis
MPRRRILVVSYYFPPTATVGGHRWHAMCRHLQRLGHETSVVTTAAEAAGPDDDALGVVRVPDLVASPALRRLLRRPPLAAPAESAADTASLQLEKPAPALLTRVVMPDSYLVSWMPAALAATRRLIAERSIDVVVTTGPPHSTHVIGLLLGRRAPLWLADFRDGWGFEPLGAPWPTAPQRALDRALERRVVARADAVLGATRPIADDLADRLGGRASWVPNGWDPDRAPDGSATAPPGNPTASRDTVTLVHTGKLSGPRGRDPRPLFAALRALRAEGPVDGRREVRLVLAGQMDARDQALIAESGLGDAVEYVGVLDRRAVVVLQRDADALLLLTALQRNASEATGKVFEYLASGRPIVALAHDNEAARIVSETCTGVVVPPDDDAAILDALRQMADGRLTRAYAPRALERFTYPGPALAVLDAVEQAERLRG